MDRYIAFDTETTGFSKEACILEIAFVKMEGGQQVERFSQLLCPDVDWDSKEVKSALEANHITREMLKDQPSFEQMQPAITQWLTCGLPWLGHNLKFDIQMLDQEYQRLEMPIPNTPGGVPLDTMLLDLHLNPGKLRRKLYLVAERWGVQPDAELHRAMADVELTVKVFEKMRPKLPDLAHTQQYVKTASAQWEKIVSGFRR